MSRTEGNSQSYVKAWSKFSASQPICRTKSSNAIWAICLRWCSLSSKKKRTVSFCPVTKGIVNSLFYLLFFLGAKATLKLLFFNYQIFTKFNFKSVKYSSSKIAFYLFKSTVWYNFRLFFWLLNKAEPRAETNWVWSNFVTKKTLWLNILLGWLQYNTSEWIQHQV